jgi:hypothetical protein
MFLQRLLFLIVPALDAGILLADEKMTGSSPVKMRAGEGCAIS